MLFDIVHRTDYRYGQPASEAYIEARLTPPRNERQTILKHEIDFNPVNPISTYHDYFGNVVAFYSNTLRHDRLSIANHVQVETHEVPLPTDSLAVTIAEARQIFSSKLTDIFDYLQPTPAVPTGSPSMDWTKKFFPSDQSLLDCLQNLNEAIYKKFRYDPNATDNATPLKTVWKQRAGVCQDFSHIMLSVMRTAGIPCRYVCGYIETDPVQPKPGVRRLVGSSATHAWVEALTPGMQWVPLDPTNNQWCGPRHVTMAYGRDFGDASPLRGTFKGSSAQQMKIKVLMKRLSRKKS